MYDLVIRGGEVVDGSGLPAFRADVGVRAGRIARIGRIPERGREELDARGLVVAPGFIDGHTHMDAQVAWDPLGTCSCWHGVTTVIMGNCGFTLAPCRSDEKHLVLRNLERAEDIPAEAMAAGIDWTWETFAEYLDAVERWPKGINYAGYVGHSALRTYAMGERAFSEPATPDDLAAMKRELVDALRAGAIGFTTSRTRNHETADGKPVYGSIASPANSPYSIAVGAIEHHFYANLCRALGCERWIEHQTDDAVQNAIRADFRAAFARRTRDEWVTDLGPADACVSPVATVPEVVADVHFRARSTFVEAHREGGPPFEQVGWLLAGMDRSQSSPRVPDATATDTDGLLREAGFTPEEIASLREEGAVA